MEVEFRINIEINGYSEDGRFFSLFQNFYDNDGNHLAHLDLAFGLKYRDKETDINAREIF